MWKVKPLSSIELRHLRYFLAAAEHGSFRKAGIALAVQESAISRRVRDLEDRLGASLFLRHNGGVKLTMAGQNFLDQTRAAMKHLGDGVIDVGAIGRSESGHLRVGIFSSLASGFLYELFQDYDADPVEISIARSGKLVEETGRQRREDANTQMAALTPSNRTDIDHSVAEMLNGQSCLLEEVPPCRRELHAAVVTLEQRGAETILQVSDSATYRRFLHGQCHTGFAEAAMFGGGKEIAEMAKLNGGKRLHLPHLRDLSRWLCGARSGGEQTDNDAACHGPNKSNIGFLDNMLCDSRRLSTAEDRL